jgi:hypothetical protein
MALARVVTFEGVDDARIAQLKQNVESGERPENLPASELIILHDPDGQKSIAIMFFENDADYEKGHEVMEAMPSEETPGRRTSVAKYDVAVRATG